MNMEQQEDNMNTNPNFEQTPSQQRALNTTSPPASRASSALGQGTANTGLPRRRIKWTHDMNVSVLRAYYMARRDNSLVGYRQQMYNIFLAERPEMGHLTQQNLADRRAAIIRNNLIPPTLQEEIRQSILNEHSQEISQHNNDNRYNQENIQRNNQTSTQPDTAETVAQDTTNTVQAATEVRATETSQSIHAEIQGDDITSIVKFTYNVAKIKFMEMNPKNRPYLLKQKSSRELYRITSIVNTEIIPTEIPRDPSYDQIVSIIYCSAYTITQTINQLQKKRGHHNGHLETTTAATNNSRNREETTSSHPKKPRWQARLQEKIEKIRQDLGYITSYMSNKTGKRSRNKLNKIRRKYITHTQFDPPNRTIEQIRDTIKQKLAKYTTRLRNYIKSYNRTTQNKLFEDNERLFYNTIAKPPTEIASQSSAVNITEMESYWKAIWSQGVTHNLNPSWIDSIREITGPNAPMCMSTINREIFGKAIKRLHNWKQPGCDRIHNYYYKYLTSLHDYIIRVYNNIIADPNLIPHDMCTGITYLKPKVDTPVSATQFRPITCLNTGYKIFTSCIAIMIAEYCKNRSIIAEEQKGCQQDTKGCKDQLVIDSVVTKQAIRSKKNLHTAFIDYQKAFDSIPHSWLLEVLYMYKIDPSIVNCVKGLMKFWVTTLHIREGTKTVVSQPIQIRRGIYQGDSLSPLLFCLGLNPLSSLLTRSQYGYKLKSTEAHRISHCFYMDDLKLYSNTKPNLNKLLKIVEIFTNDVRMMFGIDKCKTQSITKGKYSTSQNFTTADGSQITPLTPNERYKYLGIKQHITIDHSAQKKDITEEFTNRVYKICKSKLNGRNLIKAINTYAIPLLTYTFGVISWSNSDLNNLDRKVRTILTGAKHHHPRSSIERLNIPRKYGGRGLLNIQMLHDRQIEHLTRYFLRVATTSALYQAVVSADDNLTPLNLKHTSDVQPATIENLIDKWKTKPLHGKYPNYIHQQHIDFDQTNNWLKRGNMFSESEGFIIAIQDGVISTRNYRKYIMRDNTLSDDKCRRCGGTSETIPHLLNSCAALTQSHYKQRHDDVGKIVYLKTLKKLNIEEEAMPYYKYKPNAIKENQRYVIYWDRSILMNNSLDTTPANRPDMIIINKEEKTAKIIDFAVPYESNILDTIQTKKLKYRQLAEYLKNSQSLTRVDIIPIVISSMGTVPKETTDGISSLGLHIGTITELQKAILIRTVSMMREILE